MKAYDKRVNTWDAEDLRGSHGITSTRPKRKDRVFKKQMRTENKREIKRDLEY